MYKYFEYSDFKIFVKVYSQFMTVYLLFIESVLAFLSQHIFLVNKSYIETVL